MRTKRLYLFLVGSLLLFTRADLFSQITVQLLKVQVLRNEKIISLKCDGEYYLFDKASGNKYKLKDNRGYLVKPSGDEIYFSGRKFNSGIKITAMNSKSKAEINGKKYRGNVILIAEDDRLSAINELDVELYLYGVLPKEVITSWPMESLKAQAIISRTYALKKLGLHKKEGFDLCDTTHCQVYGGADIENQRTNDAVNETRGEVLFYEGKLASTFFHGSCGGYTENVENVWGMKAPEYLTGRPVKYSNGDRKDFWRRKISEDLIRKKLAGIGFDLGEIERIRIAGKSRSGRALDLKIYGEKKTIEIKASKFRTTVDAWNIRSTMFSEIEKKGKYFEFSGFGWGHGVGLCQESAKNMANKGYKSSKILKFFYPGTYLAKWDEAEH